MDLRNSPVIVLNQNTRRETGRKAQLANISAAKSVADIVRTCLGPRAMLKMLLDPMGGIVMTNDGNSIVREIDVTHPAAKSVIELSRTQDEEVGDGTTSVVILAGEVLSVAEPLVERGMHPQVIVSAFFKALADALAAIDKYTIKVDVQNREEVLKLIKSSIGTKFINRYYDLMCNLALDAVKTVEIDINGRKEVDIKRYVRIEKIPSGDISQCKVLSGVMFNKDIVHPKMRRVIKNPRILLLDCNLEYKKGESQTLIQFEKPEDFDVILRQEEEEVQRMIDDIAKFKPDLIITEKGISDLAQHFLVKYNISALRRLKKTDNNRVARATGATIVNRTDEIRESDIGHAGLFEVAKIGDEYFSYIVECKNPKACTVVLRGGSKDVLNEIERNLTDAMNTARNIVFDPKLVPGGGAVEMALAQELTEKAKSVTGIEQWPYRTIALALEIIPQTLAQNCGADTIRVLTALRAKHTGGANASWGVNGETGQIADMKELGIYEPVVVKTQTIKTAVEAACLLLRIDDIVSGISKKKKEGGAPKPNENAEEAAPPLTGED